MLHVQFGLLLHVLHVQFGLLLHVLHVLIVFFLGLGVLMLLLVAVLIFPQLGRECVYAAAGCVGEDDDVLLDQGS